MRQARSFLLLQSDNPFWQFSLAVYAAPGVAAECLALQRELGIDVNMLLFCAWLGAARKTSITVQDIDTFESIVRPWQEFVIRALRSARDALKPMPEMVHDEVQELRKQILSVELRSEQIEQALLFQVASARAPAAAAATADAAVRTNLRAFLQSKARGHEPAGLSVDSLTQAALAAAS